MALSFTKDWYTSQRMTISSEESHSNSTITSWATLENGKPLNSSQGKYCWLGITQKLSTAFHPQTDGDSERVNQKIEQYLRIYGNFQQDNWAALLPIIEFAHNARPYHSTHQSPFEIWYGFQPTFQPPMRLQTRVQSVEERTKYLEQVRKEVTAALLLAAQEMRKSGTTIPSHEFQKDDLVLLEATNLQVTHPKAKLAPRRYGPFKVLWASPTNCKLELPPRMKVHPVFHNSLLKPYTETMAHGPNFELPTPEIVEGEEGHYEIERILTSRPTRNRKSTQYLVKWKGYPDSENSWIPEKELSHAKELLAKFRATKIHSITGVMGPKEGILSRAKLATSQNPRNSDRATNLAPEQRYSQVVQIRKPTRGPEKQARDRGNMSHDSSRDPHASLIARDLSRAHIRSHDPTRFRRVSHPLINTWQTVGTNQRINERMGIPLTKRNPQRDSPLALKRIEPVRSNAQYCAAAIGTPPYS